VAAGTPAAGVAAPSPGGVEVGGLQIHTHYKSILSQRVSIHQSRESLMKSGEY
jgi:hypothetical protein